MVWSDDKILKIGIRMFSNLRTKNIISSEQSFLFNRIIPI